MRWYVSFDGDTQGPFTVAELRELSAGGNIPVGAFARREDGQGWMPFDLQSVVAASQPTAPVSLVPQPAKPNRLLFVVGGAVIAGVALGGLIMINGATSHSESEEAMRQSGERLNEVREIERRAVASAATPAGPRYVALSEAISGKSLEEAFRAVRPEFKDYGESASPGAQALSAWAASSLKWAEIQALPPGKASAAFKDVAAERGKRICMTGLVEDIVVQRGQGTAAATVGTMSTYQDVLTFAAAGSTEGVVRNSQGRFCGVLTEINQYESVSKRIVASLVVIGMFDLPQNKKTTPAQ